LQSIKSQVGDFGMEIVWINDGSDETNSTLLEKQLEEFKETTRFVKIVYKKQENAGVCKSLHYGLSLCTNEIVFRMDSDDAMFRERIQTQLDFMKNNPNVPCCGSNIQFLRSTGLGEITQHKEWITWNDYKENKSHWIMNHPTLCFRKSAVLEIGSYNIETNSAFEDLELELRLLKKYGILYNFPKILLYYRVHEDQVTFNGKTSTPYWIEKRIKFIEDLISS
jgi:amylovoran biosynthesis glycosyltransferase AmsE